MSIELFWDARPETDAFFGGTCFEAGVQWMEWRLYRAGVDEPVAEQAEPCADGIDVIDPRAGEYWLEITGFDEDDAEVWQATCPMDEERTLTVLRFDVAYACEIAAP